MRARPPGAEPYRSRMSILLILMPPRPRGPGRDAAGPADWPWVLSADGRVPSAQGHGAPASWPRASSVLAVLADGDVSWHRITLPKAPASRLQQALRGVLEEQLLDDDGALHFALPPDAGPGRPTWVAVTHRPWLAAQLARIEAGGRPVDRVLPAVMPGETGQPVQAHFTPAPDAGASAPALQLSWADAQGVAQFGLNGTLARARAASVGEQPVHWTATPAAAAAAEAWLGQPVSVLAEGERALLAVRTGWNLRQFELAPRHRGATALRAGWRRFLGPDWRLVRLGLAALVALQLVGLNAWAWQERRALAGKRQAMVALLQTSFPNVRAVLDAPLQMTRETDALRAAAGRPGDTDLETLLGAAAAAWPDDAAPVASLEFEPGRLSLGAPDWDEPQVAALREQLLPAGWAVGHADGILTITRAPQARP